MKVICNHCGAEVEKEAGQITRAKKMGLNLYCNRTCSGAFKRKNLTDEQKKEAKRIYDEQYRATSPTLKARRAAYYARTADREKERIVRQKRMPQHVEYCRRPEYKAKKKVFDREYRAKKAYGEFWESALLVLDIEALYDAKEIREINNLHNKTQKRKKLWLQLRKKASLLKT